MQINDVFEKKDYTEYAKWANKNNAQIIKLEDGKYQVVAIPQPPEKTIEEQKEDVRQTRRSLYIMQKDPLTCQIQALRDEQQTEEILNEIEYLQEERRRVVEKIKKENPYPKEVETVQ